MTETRRLVTGLALGALAVLGTQVVPAQAAVMVDAQVEAQGGGVFHYEFTVDNDSLADLFQVTLGDAPLGDGLIAASLTAPAGYIASYDSGLGLLDLLADTAGFFGIGSTGVFAFDSLAAPGSAFTAFDAFTFSSFPLVEESGSVAIAQVPLPGVLALLGLGLLGLPRGAWRRHCV